MALNPGEPAPGGEERRGAPMVFPYRFVTDYLLEAFNSRKVSSMHGSEFLLFRKPRNLCLVCR